MSESFLLAIAKVKYLRAWNFPPKCPLATSSSWGKDFENRLNISGEIGFFLALCTGWKWQNFKCCQCAKFSPCHCKSKTPAHLKPYTQMPTLNIFELRPKLRKSVEYLWRYIIFGGPLYMLKVENFKCCRCTKFSPCHLKSQIPGHLKLSTRMPTLNIFELRQRFRKSIEYLSRYRIFAGTVYRLKVDKFKMLSMRKVFTLPLQK